MNPLILTLALDAGLSAELTAWRSRLFPAERNYLDAHLTLFHALPGEDLDEIRDDCDEQVRAAAPFTVTLPGPFSLGRGVAIDVVAPEIHPLRARLRERWLDRLSPQDQRPRIRPHVTVQNKVDHRTARETLDQVRAAWDPATRGTADGLALWEYRGGPWVPVDLFEFSGPR